MSEDRTSNGQAPKSWLGRLAQAFSDEPKNREELLDLLRNAEKSQLLDTEVLGIIEGALQVSDMQVREIMIPRSQMIVIDSSLTPKEFLPEMISSAHSRFPVIGESPDEVVGILLAKDLLPFVLSNGIDSFDITQNLRKATFVPESKRLNVLLEEFRSNRNHMAVVVDEYGGVAGLVTIEDVLEQIVGEIEDEHDAEEDDTNIKQFENNGFIVKALTPIEDFNDYFNCDFNEDEFDTIGGIVTQQFGHLPRRDEAVEVGGVHFKVLNADNRRIRLLQITLPNQSVNEK
jgi:magnesium and cobalt transporter